MGIVDFVCNAVFNVGIFTWDVVLTLGNLVQFSRAVGKVTPAGHPGYGGRWPEYKPSQPGDSRCSCPALNAMANHGIIARNGRGIRFTELTHQIRTTYNFAPSFCVLVPHIAARMLNRKYKEDTLDLEELNLHNGIEHDASLTRLDTALQPNQAIKHEKFIEELLSFATGKDADGNILLTKRDLSRIMGKRRAEAKVTNKEYTLSFSHKMFGSSNSATMLTILGGRVSDLRVWLLKEQLPDGWESRVRKPFGQTLLTFNFTVVPIEWGIRESDWTDDARRAAANEATAT